MWSGPRSLSDAESSLISPMAELNETTFRRTVLVGGGTCLVCYLAIAQIPGRLGMQLLLTAGIALLGCALAYLLRSRSLLVGHIIWLLTLAATITSALVALRLPEIAFAYGFLPALAAISIGWHAGLVVQAGVAGVLWGLVRTPLAAALPPSRAGLIIGLGAFFGLLVWVVGGALLGAVERALVSLAQTQDEIEEARDQRLELKQAQEDLVKANQELARLSGRLRAMVELAGEARRAKEEFVANVSHELRTPLNMIIGFSDMIANAPRAYGAALPEAVLSDIAAIHRNSQHLARLVDDILDLSRVEAGRMALSKEWTSLGELIETAMSVVQPLFDSKGLYLKAEIPDDLPDVFCDRTRIRQVVINLLSNAGRFTERGGVRVSVRHEGGEVLLSVADTGPGIAPEDQKRLFEPFQQLDGSLSRPYGGSGLGLSISKHFVEMHGGQIWLESEVGVGTTVSFSLPVQPPAPSPLLGSSAARWLTPGYEFRARTRRSKAPLPVATPCFAVVEQGETLQRLFRRYMDDVQVIPYRDVEAALEGLRHSPAQALVVNEPPAQHTIPDYSESLPYGIPTISCWLPGEDEAARRLGVVGYLVKPVSRQQLLAAVDCVSTEVETILLVDDDPEVLRLFTRMLSSAERGYRVMRARDGMRALGLMRERKPDLMLLDLVMPGMDGFEVLRIKAQDAATREIPTLIVSARDPMNEPVVSNVLSVRKAGGLSAIEVLSCIRSITGLLSPPQSGGPARPETPPA